MLLDYPDVLTGLMRVNSRAIKNHRLDSRINLQIQRGQDPHFWEGAPKGGCTQCVALFTDFDAIPKYCFDCYKILIELRTVLELFKLLLMFENINLPEDNTRKCMVDQRKFSSVSYKGFIYCRTLVETERLLPIVEEMVHNEISPDISVKIKRGCSEYAEKFPKYAQVTSDTYIFKYKKEWKYFEEIVDNYWVFEHDVDFDKDNADADPIREVFALQYWLRYAATIGDRSYLILTKGKELEPLPAA